MVSKLDPDFLPSRIPDPGVKKAPDPGSATLLFIYRYLFRTNWYRYLSFLGRGNCSVLSEKSVKSFSFDKVHLGLAMWNLEQFLLVLGDFMYPYINLPPS
jgi:hypothetical protein